MQGLGATAPKQRVMGDTGPQEPLFDCTEFVAETLLPTVSGKYRLRGYRHTVSNHILCTSHCAGGVPEEQPNSTVH